MDFKKEFTRHFSKFSVTNLTLYLIVGQMVFFVLIMAGVVDDSSKLSLIGSRVLEGEVWRIFTFIFIPLSTSFFVLLAWYVYYLFGNTLENTWGSGRYSLYILLAWVFHVVASLIVPNVVVDNSLIFLSVFIAFAHLYPDHEIYLFFVIPVKMKWLAIVYAAYYVLSLFSAIIGARYLDLVVILFSFGNYLCFFAPDLFRFVKRSKRKSRFHAKTKQKDIEPFHVCYYCHKNDKKNKHLDFRYVEENGEYVCICTDCLSSRK